MNEYTEGVVIIPVGNLSVIPDKEADGALTVKSVEAGHPVATIGLSLTDQGMSVDVDALHGSTECTA